MEQTVYKTIREAGIAGTRAAIELARRDGWEYGGFILKQGEGYSVSDIVTDKERDAVSLVEATPKDLLARLNALKTRYDHDEEDTQSFKDEFKAFEKEHNERVVGDFHVHVTENRGNDRGEFFSGRDIHNTIQRGIFAYLGHTGTGRVFELDGHTKETLEATAGTTRQMTDYRHPLTVLLMVITDNSAPFIATGMEVFAGDRMVEVDARKAA